MQKNLLLVFLAFLVFLTGCSKKQQTSKKSHKKSLFFKLKKNTHPSTSDIHEQVDTDIDLDSESMESFALDDHLKQPRSSSSPTQSSSHSRLFSWEDLSAEQSKNQFKTLYFEFNSNILQPDQNKALKQDISLAKKMSKQSKLIVVEGHACHSAGSAIYNFTLSEKRARHVAQKLAQAGINPQQIKVAPRGQEMPKVKGGSREEQSVNRRVEIFAIDTY